MYVKDVGSAVSHWKLDETSGTRADANTTNGNDLTDNNTVGYNASGKLNNCADIERDNTESLSITDGSQTGLDITGDMTISAWINTESFSHQATIIAKDDQSSNRSFFFAILSDGRLGLDFFGAGGTTSWDTDSAQISNGTWYHVVAAIDVSVPNVDFYVNGSEVASTSNSTSATDINNSGATFFIGNYTTANNNNAYDGLIDEVTVFNEYLDSTAVSTLYNSGTPLPYGPEYELTAAVGSFTLTGIAAGLLATRLLTANVGSFVLTGIDAILSKVYSLTAEVGSFILTGNSVSLLISRLLTAAVGSFTLTGIAATLTKIYNLAADTGSFILTGIKAYIYRNTWDEKDSNSSTFTPKTANSSTWTEKEH